MAGGWAFVLAAALCGHPDCAPFVASAAHASHDPQAVRESAGRGAHDEHAKADVAANHTEHDSAVGHCGRDSGGGAASADQNQLSSESRASRLTSGDAPCGHCVEDSGPRDSFAPARQAERPQRQGLVCEPPRTRLNTPLESGFVRDIIPSQGAPPGRASTHLLNSVFRI